MRIVVRGDDRDWLIVSGRRANPILCGAGPCLRRGFAAPRHLGWARFFARPFLEEEEPVEDCGVGGHGRVEVGERMPRTELRVEGNPLRFI